ncbi:type III secretion inner membrane ring lipoprotein SctJ [Sphingomonas sp. RB3P16]|uniref:type III secretion system inner membrane ring lipoprotein SctJ n=1 Tax=Parasphingomonas frigoris TaxID=3096163 RepID=UPI002FCA7DFA
MTVRSWGRATGLLIALSLALAGCGRQELYSKLTEAQANEMVAALQRAGISASKQEKGETGWSIETAEGDFGRAVAVLQSQGYPRDDFATLGTVFKKEGFVSSPTEERARLAFGLSQELAHTISEIDGVVQARVHLALPEAQPLADAKQPSSASVFVKYRPGTNVEAQVGKIKALVVTSIEGLKYENVSVETFPAQPLPISAVQADPGSGNLLPIAIGGVLLLGGLIGYPGFRRWHQRRRRRAIVEQESGS